MRVERCMLALAVVIVLFFGAMAASGSEFRSGASVVIGKGTAVNDELFASGSSVAIDGDVVGDLLAMGGQVSLSGKVSQSANLTGGNVNVSGLIGGNLRAVGGQLIVSGGTKQNASLAGGTVVVNKSASVGRDLQVVSGDVQVDGSVGRNLNIIAGEARINGKVGGSVDARVDRLIIGPEAEIKGNLTYTAQQKVEIAPSAKISGKTIVRPAPEKKAPSSAWKFTVWAWRFLAILLIGIIFVALAPAGVSGAADRATGAFWRSLLIGLVMLVVIPVVCFVIALTLIGLPIALILLISYLILLYFSNVFAALAIGKWLFAKFGRPQMSLYLDLLVGLLILWLLIAIPYVGGLIHFIAILLGIGSMAAQRYPLVRDLRREGRL